MNITQATIKDIEGVAELFNLYRIFYKQDSDLDAAKAFIMERFQQRDSVIFVAMNEGKYIGFTQLFPSLSSVSMKRLWILNDLYVKKEGRKQGVGKLLLDAAKEYAIQTKAKGILLETAIDNDTAQSLYESYGYEMQASTYYYFLPIVDSPLA
ncbi:MAG: GNAT family N-acetyltransferase [Bacillaceae bacterium]